MALGARRTLVLADRIYNDEEEWWDVERELAATTVEAIDSLRRIQALASGAKARDLPAPVDIPRPKWVRPPAPRQSLRDAALEAKRLLGR